MLAPQMIAPCDAEGGTYIGELETDGLWTYVGESWIRTARLT